MLIATPFTANHWKIYQGWHRDRELSRRASFPDENWFKYVTRENSESGIVAFEKADGGFVSLAQFDVEDTAMQLFIAVDPDLRNKGIGKATLNNIVAAAPLMVTSIQGHIEQDNAASIAMVKSFGFIALDQKQGTDGFLTWQFTL